MVPMVMLGLVLLAGTAAARQEPEEDDVGTRSFSIPSTHYAETRFEEAERHVQARRWSEAIAALQQLIEVHHGDVLSERYEDERGRRSQFPLHPGAAAAARARLRALPAEARKIYADRYGPMAEEALAHARRALDRQALIDVARRFPITPAAPKAWWALGDLELELGNVAAAGAAWRRAADLAGGELSEGAARRLAWVESEAGASTRGALELPAAHMHLPGPGEAMGSLPGPTSHSWWVRIDDRDESPFTGSANGERFNLFPIAYEDTVFVSTSLRLLAIDIFSGKVRWQSAEPPGWAALTESDQRTEFFKGIDRESALIAPAAAGGIVVCALQIPVTQLGNTHYQSQIQITVIIPDRRLFAFDVATGAPLWNHMPPPLWDGESGTFSERTRVAGPPVIAGTRVLVPVYRPEGRMDYHVACYDLATGAYLWSTAVISGQVPLNMFGRPEQEFSAPPLRVEGERVIAVTQLGAVAALDLFTGEVLWESLYDQIPLPGASGFKSGTRQRVWKNAPPVVVGETVIATPSDSPDLIGFSLETGAVLWSVPHTRLDEPRRTSRAHLALLGASEDTIYLGGRSVLTARSAGWLGAGTTPSQFRSSRGVESNYNDPSRLPRPVLTERHVLLPTHERRIALDRFDIDREDPLFSGEWGDEMSVGRGNVLLSGGVLFTLSGKFLTAFFDWQTVEEGLAKKHRLDPTNVEVAAEFGSFLAERARVEWRDLRYREALSYIGRARAVLEPLLEPEGGRADNVLAERLHQVLRLEASVLIDNAQSPAALERLAAARTLAPDRESLRDTLLEIAAIHRQRNADRWLATLADLERECADLWMPRASLERDDVPDELVSDQETEERVRVGLWVLLERVRYHQRENDVSSELECLHAILASYGDVPLDAGATLPRQGQTASERIQQLLDGGAREAYAPFETQAQSLLERAIQEDDDTGLSAVARLFPHSVAARHARDVRVAAALETGDMRTIALILDEELPRSWTPKTSTPRETQLVLALARAAELRGNASLTHALLRSLARARPDEVSPHFAEGSKTLGELAAALPAVVVPPLFSEGAGFEVPDRSQPPIPGESNVLLGSVPLRPGVASGERTLVFARRDGLLAFSEADTSRPKWDAPLGERVGFPMDWRTGALLFPDVVVVAEGSSLRALDADTGKTVWSYTGAAKIEALCGDSGVVALAVSEHPSALALVGLDASTGVELWTRRVPDGLSTPVAGDGKLVVLPYDPLGARALVLEIATGTGELEIVLGERLPLHDRRGSWIQNGQLIVPHFTPPDSEPGSAVEAWDLESGMRAWALPAEAQRDLDSIARVGPDTYLILAPKSQYSSAGGEVVQLLPQLGATRAVPGVSIGPQDLPIGVKPNSVTQLPSPFLFIKSRDTLVRAVELPYGQRWAYSLQVDGGDPFTLMRCQPALSSKVVALAFTQDLKTKGPRPMTRTQLVLLDRNSGVQKDTRYLDDELGSVGDIELTVLGDALFIAGRRQITILEKQK